MTIQQLQYILEVQRTGTIAQAAKNLFVSNSGVSNAVNALESELGFAIFERSWNGMTPTRQGAQVLEHARHICERQQLILRTAKINETVHIETDVSSPFPEVFVKLLTENKDRTDLTLCHRYPKRNATKSLEDRLLTFESDLFVTVQYESRAGNINALKRRVFQKRLELEERMSLPAVLRIGPGHPLYSKEDLDLSDFAQDTMIDTASASVASSKMMVKYVGFAPTRVMLEDDRMVRHQLVTEGFGYTVGAQLPAGLDRQYGFRNIPIPVLKYKVLSITNPLRPLMPEAQRYLELLDEELAGVRMD